MSPAEDIKAIAFCRHSSLEKTKTSLEAVYSKNIPKKNSHQPME